MENKKDRDGWGLICRIFMEVCGMKASSEIHLDENLF
jgi:hypothetical protein